MKKAFLFFIPWIVVIDLISCGASTSSSASLVAINEKDGFGNLTDMEYLTFDKDLPGTFKSSSSSGNLKWNVIIDAKDGRFCFVLKEKGKDVNVTTSSVTPSLVDENTRYTVSFRAEDGTTTSLYGRLEVSQSYKMNALVLRGLEEPGDFDCREFFSSDLSYKVIIESDYGLYTIENLDMSGFSILVFDDSLYRKGIQLMDAGKYQEALDVFEEYRANNEISYSYFETPVQVYKCKTLIWENYDIGTKGPSGGYVFYDCDKDNKYGNPDGLISSECGWRFLEVAPADLHVIKGIPTVDSSLNEYAKTNGKCVFGYYRTSYNGKNIEIKTDTSIGSGKTNTENLVNAMGNCAYESMDGIGITPDYAARLCWILEYEYDGVVYKDWFLPSKDELNYMLKLYRKGVGSFSDTEYWSSSEDITGLMLGQLFNNGNNVVKNVRPIRAF